MNVYLWFWFFLYEVVNEDLEWIFVEKDRFLNDYDKDFDGRFDF